MLLITSFCKFGNDIVSKASGSWEIEAMRTHNCLMEDLPTVGAEQDPIRDHISAILTRLGENVNREGLLETPRRFEKAMRFLTSGYEVNLQELVGNAVFNEASDGIVIVRDIELFSLCEHHLLPFFGKVHVAY